MKTYSGCPEKMRARRETIIGPYRQHFSHSLPESKQYWTMCATHTDDQGELLQGSELDQMLKSGIIILDQFYGVDIEADIIEANAAGIPGPHWHHGDLMDEMSSALRDGKFNPGIVNCDHLLMPHSGGAAYVSRCLQFLADQNDLLMVANLILEPPYNEAICTPGEYIDELWKHAQFQDAMRRGWQYDDAVYVYGGTGRRSSTVLGSIVFWK
jgi:hypothetical protein